MSVKILYCFDKIVLCRCFQLSMPSLTLSHSHGCLFG